MEKPIRNNMVAVLVSPGYGSGWYAWNTNHPECVFDPEIVKIVLGEESGSISDIAGSKWDQGNDYFYSGGADQLVVNWLPIGTEFRIEEYDGSESLTTLKDLYLIA